MCFITIQCGPKAIFSFAPIGSTRNQTGKLAKEIMGSISSNPFLSSSDFSSIQQLRLIVIVPPSDIDATSTIITHSTHHGEVKKSNGSFCASKTTIGRFSGHNDTMTVFILRKYCCNGFEFVPALCHSGVEKQNPTKFVCPLSL